ncbi:MAG: TraB/GumN family protein, partial [Bacteroidetes bacterium]|nr:TraB/GumN family protein [Bacteroidota bacterium]
RSALDSYSFLSRVKGRRDPFTAPHIIRADIDLNQLHPDTIEFLNIIGKHLSNDSTFLNRLQAYNAWIEQHMTPELKQTLMDDILLKRNREVIRYLDNALGKYDTIVIPWGALHMPAIEKAVLDRGFKLVEARRRTSIDLKNIPYAQLYRKLSKETVRYLGL